MVFLVHDLRSLVWAGACVWPTPRGVGLHRGGGVRPTPRGVGLPLVWSLIPEGRGVRSLVWVGGCVRPTPRGVGLHRGGGVRPTPRGVGLPLVWLLVPVCGSGGTIILLWWFALLSTFVVCPCVMSFAFSSLAYLLVVAGFGGPLLLIASLPGHVSCFLPMLVGTRRLSGEGGVPWRCSGDGGLSFL